MRYSPGSGLLFGGLLRGHTIGRGRAAVRSKPELRPRVSRATSELIGFLRGIVADGHVSPDESEQLARWAVGNREIADLWPVNVLVQRLERIYRDGIADEDECADLAQLLKEIVGHQDDETFLFGPTDLPLRQQNTESCRIRG